MHASVDKHMPYCCREKETMNEKRRIEEMQMQLRMKEHELNFVREK
jgi:hypothetical protein